MAPSPGATGGAFALRTLQVPGDTVEVGLGDHGTDLDVLADSRLPDDRSPDLADELPRTPDPSSRSRRRAVPRRRPRDRRTAPAEVRAAARDKDHVRIREVDLWFQDALARTADLPRAAGSFERLTARLRMFVTVLDMDCSEACGTILNEDAAVLDALHDGDGDGDEAARLWRVKIERCVRCMIAQRPGDDIAPHLWTTPAGRPRLGPEDARGAAH
ncbi:hypothetical protein ABZ078_15870 [Streptomyces sp. NPDC006385]|uniref:hypothetical protein n=1 Tax=Streptomyces sp. NPDC006385 TaxID=3156761 RepID=UPI0033A9EF0C